MVVKEKGRRAGCLRRFALEQAGAGVCRVFDNRMARAWSAMVASALSEIV